MEPYRTVLTRFRKTRSIAVLLAGAFALGSAGSAIAERACPHHAERHGAVAGAAAGDADRADGLPPGNDALHEGHDPLHGSPGSDGAAPGAYGAEDPGPHAPASGHHESGDCSCLGPCQGAAAPLPSATAAPDRTPEGTLRRVAAAPVDEVGLAPTPYLLPFANAPPAR